MSTAHVDPARVELPTTRRIGLRAVLAGLAVASLYPAAIILRAETARFGLPEAVAGYVVLLSAALGPLLLAWGVLAMRRRSLAPLTARSALLVPLLSVLASAVGVAAFTYEWARATPFVVPSDTGGEPHTFDLPLQEIVWMQFTSIHVVALAISAAAFVGVVTARRGWRAGLASALLPASVTAISVGPWWDSAIPAAEVVLVTTVLATIPFAAGYAATSPTEPGPVAAEGTDAAD